MGAVWERDDLTSTQKLVLLALADWANDEGLCWPSIDRIAVKASLTPRAVQKTIKSLEEAQFLRREEIRGKGNKYWVSLPLNHVHPRTTFTPPPNHVHPTPEPRSPNTSKIHQRTTKSNIAAKPESVSEDVWRDFIELRKAKRAPLSNTALQAIEREAGKAGWTLNDALAESVARGWQGFKADWVKETNNGTTNWRGGADRRSSLARAIDEGLDFLG
jgi:hypothetical protein